MTTVIIGKTGLTFNSAGVPTDSNAVHVNVSNEISGLTEKVSPVAGDFLIIEDSANSFAKRKVDIDNLPGGGVGGGTNVKVDGGATLTTADFTDGGDIDFTDSGGTITAAIKADAVTFAKMQNISTARILGRNSASSGDTEELAAATVRAMLNVEDGATADQSAGEIEAIVNHDNLLGFVAAEHIDWTADQGATNIDPANITGLADANIGSGANIDAAKIGTGVVSTTEFNFLDGVTSGIQGQIDGLAGAGVSDGDKGDITVSGSGTVWTIDNTVVTFAKIQNIATATFVGRTTAGTGSAEALTAAQARAILNVEDGADVTDTANVTAAGAVMDSELTSETHVKALNQSVISGAAPTFGTANMTDATNKRFMTDAQEAVVDSTSGTNTGDEPAASDTVSGVVELATAAETTAGTDGTRAMTPSGFAASNRNIRFVDIVLVAPSTDVAVDVNLYEWTSPFDCTIIQDDTETSWFSAWIDTPGTGGTMVVDIHLDTVAGGYDGTGNTIMATSKLNIETGEDGTATAATQPDLTTTDVAKGDRFIFAVDSVHSTTAAKGLTVRLPLRPD